MRFIIFVLIWGSTITVNAQEVGASPELIKSIYFGGGSYYIDGAQIQELETFIKSVQGIENYSITIHSHTDNIGSVEFNQRLSEMRSESAISELLKLSISLERIEIKDFGKFNPIYDNSTLEGRLRNRRVDIILWPNPTL